MDGTAASKGWWGLMPDPDDRFSPDEYLEGHKKLVRVEETSVAERKQPAEKKSGFWPGSCLIFFPYVKCICLVHW